MKIVIEYDSCWRNSFLDGSNNETLPDKKGRKFVAASSSLNDRDHPENFKKVDLTITTILGVLCRLIGDQRKLYQARKSENYYFHSLENGISFFDSPYESVISSEIVYIRNMTGSDDRESFTGPIDTSHWLFSANFATDLWSVLFLDFSDLIRYIVEGAEKNVSVELDPRVIVGKVGELKSIPISKISEYKITEDDLVKTINVLIDASLCDQMKASFPSMIKTFRDIVYIKDSKVDMKALYCSALYLKLLRLRNLGFEIKSNIKGFSVAGMTPKDFMSNFTVGKKKVYGNPYLKKVLIKGEGETRNMLTKASGKLEINLDIDVAKGNELKTLIENAGVSSFFLGKKGLAYVSHIDPRPARRNYESLF